MDFVYDYETLSNCFVGVFIDVRSDEKKVFVVHELRNDFQKFVDFLSEAIKSKTWQISFNGLNFDAQITEKILKERAILSKKSPDEIARYLYKYAQSVIDRSRNKMFQEFYESKMKIRQLDVFKLNHWDNANKFTSLKELQFATDWHNLQSMPIHHTQEVTTLDEIDTIIEYCVNDVITTKKVLYLSKPLLEVRKQVKSKYGLPCDNYSNTKLGSELLLKLYCQATGKDPYEVKQYRTNRPEIPIKDILFDYISFKTEELKQFHESLKTKIIRNTKNDFTYKKTFKNYVFHYGAGGIHQCIEPGIYRADEGYIIKDLDVASLYPSIACMNDMYPAHLGKEFFSVYKEGIVDVRLAEKRKGKDGDRAIIEGFKEAANASYGNSNSIYSWLYDPQYTMQTTINGQLLITMLVEDLIVNIPDSQLLQTNTDGATLRIPKDKEDIYYSVCKKWEEVTKLTLEFADYKEMFIWDVNNYIAVYTDPSKSPKCKGRFEWEDQEKYRYTHLHKNKSHLIIPKTIFNFLIHKTPIEDYIRNYRNIYHFCAFVKAPHGWKFKKLSTINGDYVEENIQKDVRYYVSVKGSKILKCNINDGRKIQVEAGKWMQTEFNLYKEKPWEEYDIDYKYYIEAVYNELETLIPKSNNQISLFQ
jgi:hypothetical protein